MRVPVAARAGAAHLALPLAPTHEEPAQRLALDALVGGLAMCCAAAARLAIEQVVGGVAPFVLTFPAVMAATLLRGSAAGAIALVSCQLLTVRYVFPNWMADRDGLAVGLANVTLSTLALLGMLWAAAAYRRASAQLQMQCRREVETLSLLIVEMDHRTKNNFQVAANLLAHQAISSPDLQLSHELERAAFRLKAIASVYEGIQTDRRDGERVDLAAHLRRIVGLLRDGATPGHIGLTLELEPVEVSLEPATIIGLIVNEWVTNAVKYAFAGGPGCITVRLARQPDHFMVTVEDDGEVDAPAMREGQGSGLIRSLADVMGAAVRIERENGMRCSLRVPG